MEDLGIVVQGALDQLVDHSLPRLGNTFNATTALDNSRGRQPMWVFIKVKYESVYICHSPARSRHDKRYGLKMTQ